MGVLYKVRIKIWFLVFRRAVPICSVLLALVLIALLIHTTIIVCADSIDDALINVQIPNPCYKFPLQKIPREPQKISYEVFSAGREEGWVEG